MLTTLRPRLVPNSTWPADSANSVSSPPRPTSAPGWKCVPRWRTRISPALTRWPPNLLTPSRWAVESRPLREELAPFLCAIASGLPDVLDRRVRAGRGVNDGVPGRRVRRGRHGRLADAGHPQHRERLPVALPLAVAGL